MPTTILIARGSSGTGATLARRFHESGQRICSTARARSALEAEDRVRLPLLKKLPPAQVFDARRSQMSARDGLHG